MKNILSTSLTELTRRRIPDFNNLLAVLQRRTPSRPVINLTGYDNLCFLMYDAPELIQAIVDKLGEFYLRGYQLALARSRALIEKTQKIGYAFGSGNTIAGYIPSDHYIVMNKAAMLD